MNREARLTPEEARVAELAAWGATQKEIACYLKKSVNTVANQFRSIYEKVGISKINELSAWWFCTHFNISFDLSPIKRSVGASVMILLFLFQLFTQPGEVYRRSVRSRRSEYELICLGESFFT